MRVLLIDDDTQRREALRGLLERWEGIAVVGEADQARGLLACVNRIRPDMVLLEWELAGTPGVGLLLGLQASRHCPRVIVLSDHERARREALTAGADAFVHRGGTPERLLTRLWAAISPARVGRL